MTNRIVRGNLFHRKTRTLMTILAIAVEVAMILLILGLSDGLLEESAQRKRGIGADIIIRPSASASLITTGTNGLPVVVDRRTRSMPEVAVAAGTTIILPTNLQTITGVDWEKLDRMAGGIRFIQGGPLKVPTTSSSTRLRAAEEASRSAIRCGCSITISIVVGIIETGKMSRIFIPR